MFNHGSPKGGGHNERGGSINIERAEGFLITQHFHIEFGKEWVEQRGQQVLVFFICPKVTASTVTVSN